MAWAATIGAVLGGYLLGSVSFAVLISKVLGLADPRTYGSRNPGATNVLRSGNRTAAVLTLLGDALKGTAAIWLAHRFGAAYGVDETGLALTGLAAFVGHLYPLYFRFKGGKGVATFFGVIAMLDISVGLMAGVAWLLVAYFFRYSSAASLAAAVVALFGWAFAVGFDAGLICVAIMVSLLIVRHKQNIVNLRAGRERRIGEKSAAHR
ncbi:MAG TPA: glycerol-3-phosphate 1-O-acyltransferase PlsY [Burkholderiaceae bacterium]|nr:glycerol-3-phosphate 1-O-acyltransferase PlsY [Burkholderiaceae bacterium]